MSDAELLYDASTTIYNQIAKLRRGLPIAEAKARTGAEKLQVKVKYLSKISALDAQYKAVYEALKKAVKV